MFRWLVMFVLVLALAGPVTAMRDPEAGGPADTRPLAALDSASGQGGGSTYVFSEEVVKGEERGGFVFRMMVRTPTFSAGAVAARDIRAHRHSDGDHVLYMVSGRGSINLDGRTVGLRPGLLLYVPKGVIHAVKATTPTLQFVDFAQPPFDPAKIEWMQ